MNEVDMLMGASTLIYTHREGTEQAMIDSLVRIQNFIMNEPDFISCIDVPKIKNFLSYVIFPEIQFNFAWNKIISFNLFIYSACNVRDCLHII